MDSIKDPRRSPPDAFEGRAVLEALRKGYQGRDAALLASVYAEDAEFTICNRNNPPARRLVLRGRAAVRRMFEDLCAREMTHQIAHMTVGDASIAFSATCRYPDGTQVVGLNVATLKEGRILSEINVACWDE
jgi:ketosteroid isomerase-like protein